MPDLIKPTVRLFIPKFGKVCDVNVDDAQMFREQYQAIDESAYLAAGDAQKPIKPNPFKGTGKSTGGKPEVGVPGAESDPNASAVTDPTP